MDLFALPPVHRMRERMLNAVWGHTFSGTPQVRKCTCFTSTRVQILTQKEQLDVLVQLLTTASGDARHLQNRSKTFVEQVLSLNLLALLVQKYKY